MKLKKILVPLDGSPLAADAIEAAVDLAAGNPVTLVLLRAAEAHTLPCADPTNEQVRVVREAEDYLTSVKDRLAKRGMTTVETSVWYGPPVAAIVDAARLKKADLVVMSSHGRSGLGRLLLGSVAESVLRSTAVPVCIVRPPGAPVEAPEGKAEAAAEKGAPLHV
jgi:nucleotide-binding universal stress UspA family protein